MRDPESVIEEMKGLGIGNDGNIGSVKTDKSSVRSEIEAHRSVVSHMCSVANALSNAVTEARDLARRANEALDELERLTEDLNAEESDQQVENQV